MEPVGIEDTNKNEVNKFHPLMPGMFFYENKIICNWEELYSGIISASTMYIYGEGVFR